MGIVRIAEFAAIAGVPIKTLRFYDEIGLFQPFFRHPVTGYRDYHPRQLPELATIVALRRLEVPLREIKAALRAGSKRRKRQLLEEAQQKLRRSLDEQERSLAWIEAELARSEGPPDGSAILLCDRPAFRIASVRARLGAPTDIAELEAELLDRIPEHARGRRRGSLWHACEGDPAPLEAEHFVELVAPVTDPRVITRT